MHSIKQTEGAAADIKGGAAAYSAKTQIHTHSEELWVKFIDIWRKDNKN